MTGSNNRRGPYRVSQPCSAGSSLIIAEFNRPTFLRELTPMASTAQIEANRRNATRSTGPKSTNGEQITRLNSYKNGNRSRTIMPGLPHEDPDRIQQRTEQYLDELQPRDAAELDLVHQMAQLSLAVERA